MNLFELKAEVRNDLGKGASRRLRRNADKIPAIVYGGDKTPSSIALDHSEVLQHIEHEAFYSHILVLTIDGKKNNVILKDMQRHPFKPKVTHMDFQRVSQNEVITMYVPIHFLNEESCKGVKQGGHIIHNMMTVGVNCKAKDLPEFIEIDVADLELNGVIHLTEIKLPKGVTLVELSHGEEHDQPVVSVHQHRGGAEASSTGDSDESTEE